MNWNFIDSDLPTNKTIVDPWTWYKNFRVKDKASTVVNNDGTTTTTLTYNKLLDLFTYKDVMVPDFSGQGTEGEPSVHTVLESDNNKFKKYSEINGLFGAQKINKPDVNAVPLGY